MNYFRSIACLVACCVCIGAYAEDPSAPIAVGGEAEFAIEVRQGELEDGEVSAYYVAGPMRTTAALPEGYPRPTPAGAMEIKAYPSVRRAEITVDASPRMGMNLAFFPLFRHIKNRDIAMTAPVEADLPAMARQGAARQMAREDAANLGVKEEDDSMTVSFLYRTSDLGPTGQAEENVRVIDTEPVTVVSLGIRGTMGNQRIEREVAKLYEWLEAQGERNPGPDGEPAAGRWVADGDPRIMGYNGPDVPRRNQWWEVQVPVRWTSDASEASSDEASDRPS